MALRKDSSRRKEARRRLRRRRYNVFPRIRAYFLAGVLVTAPVAITLAAAWWLIELVDRNIVPMIPEHWNPDTYLRETIGLEIGLPGLGLLILFVAITLIGALTAGFLGRMVVSLGERILAQMPIIRSVYSAIKQILETVLKQQSNAFRQAVLIEYPRRGMWAVGFVTGTTEGEVQNLVREDVVNIFLPTTPNPTSGFLLFVPRKDLVTLNMSVEEAVKMVISGGIVTPPDRRSDAERAIPQVSSATYEDTDIQREKSPDRPPVNPSED
ncbi:MAG: DUF502 domain-containing protein [Alphaproteobacteria bacterium]|nr:DUF502 domain-containing protein [Alphaproteobacteria bacterium]